VEHQLKAVEPIIDGRYLRAETQKAALAAAAGLPVAGSAAAFPEAVPASPSPVAPTHDA
jgi:NAD(P)H-quinone oxidoreductase subunit K